MVCRTNTVLLMDVSEHDINCSLEWDNLLSFLLICFDQRQSFNKTARKLTFLYSVLQVTWLNNDIGRSRRNFLASVFLINFQCIIFLVLLKYIDRRFLETPTHSACLRHFVYLKFESSEYCDCVSHAAPFCWHDTPPSVDLFIWIFV